MKQSHRGTQPRRLDALNVDSSSLLSRGLLALLLLGYVLLIYTVVIAIGAAILGLPVQLPTPWWLDGLAFGIIALGFLPVSRWLFVRINDLVYGEYDNPYDLVAGITHHLKSMTNPAVTLPLLVQDIASDLRLSYVAIETTDFEPPLSYEAGAPPDGNGIIQLSILYLEQPIGMLRVSPYKGTRFLSDAHRRLLQDIALQIGVALYAARITAEVQKSREKLVLVREEERRRIRNDLHDGLGPTLSSLQLQMSAIRRLLHTDTARAEDMIQDMRDDLRSATAEIRQLVYDLRPPMLDELGLIEALKNSLPQNSEVAFELLSPEPMPELPAAVEVALFRIVNEAVHNVIKHAEASRCELVIEVAGSVLLLTITDNGNGLPEGLRYGVGLSAMQERTRELGGTILIQSREEGGTHVSVQLPFSGV